MQMWNLKKLSDSQPAIRRDIIRRLGQVAVSFILIALLLFVSAGTLNYPYALLYMAAYLLVILAGSFTLPLEVIAERGSKKGNVEKWDKLLSALMGSSSFCIYIVSGLDFRYHWTPALTAELHLESIFIFVMGCALVIWDMRTNYFFSTAVRLQIERGHTVCSTGPYKYIRHPGYLGMILYNLVSPTFLGSLWAMIPALITLCLFIVRTWLEDRTLIRKLPGYREYAAHVRYRLLKWIW
jgi:protein-S-isoprenylcysteine O-methyltransferase Ste14